MKLHQRLAILSLAVMTAVILWWPLDSLAADFRAGAVTVSAPWSRATPGPLTVGVVYLQLTNGGAAPDRLLGGKTAAAERVEIHSTENEGGVMRMRSVEAIALPPGQTLRFDPASGFHLMLLNLAAPLKEGGEFALELTFERAGMIALRVPVGAIGALQPPTDGDDDPHAGHH